MSITNMELESIKNSLKTGESKKSHQHWDDVLVRNYYSHYFQGLTPKELDKDFNKDIRTLANALSKLPETERKDLINVLSRVIEFYMESKIEKEIENSFSKLFKF